MGCIEGVLLDGDAEGAVLLAEGGEFGEHGAGFEDQGGLLCELLKGTQFDLDEISEVHYLLLLE